jgi:exportin-1
MLQASSNVDVLSNPENVKVLSNILKTNVAACVSIGTFFVPQISRNFLDMLELYKAVSSIISTSVATEGKSNDSSLRTGNIDSHLRTDRDQNPKN